MKFIIIVLVIVLLVQQRDCHEDKRIKRAGIDLSTLLRDLFAKSASTSAAFSVGASRGSYMGSVDASKPRPPPRPTTTTTTTTTDHPFNMLFRNIFNKSNGKVPPIGNQVAPPPPPPPAPTNGPTRISLPVARPQPPLSTMCGGTFAIPFHPCGNIPQSQQPPAQNPPPQNQGPPPQQQSQQNQGPPPQQQPQQNQSPPAQPQAPQQPQGNPPQPQGPPPCDNSLGLPFDVCGNFPPLFQQQDQSQGQPQGQPPQQQGQPPQNQQPQSQSPQTQPSQSSQQPQNPPPNAPLPIPEDPTRPPVSDQATNFLPPFSADSNPNLGPQCNENEPPFYCNDFIPQRPSYENSVLPTPEYQSSRYESRLGNGVLGGYNPPGFVYYRNTQPYHGYTQQEFRYLNYH